jgi:hypothetical protein
MSIEGFLEGVVGDVPEADFSVKCGGYQLFLAVHYGDDCLNWS